MRRVKISRRPFMKHQQACYDRALADGQNMACFMEMRLGKTLTTVRWGVAVPPTPLLGIEACLVVAPVTVLEAWEKELSLEGELYIVAHGISADKRMQAAEEAFSSPERVWVLLNYEGLRATPDLALLPWKVVILDESTAVKNPDSQISNICCGGWVKRRNHSRVYYPGFPNAYRKAVLSGLPAPESDLDLFQQFKFLDGHFMGDHEFYQYRSRRFEIDFRTGKWKPKFGQAKMIKEYVHDRAYVLRRNDAGLGRKKIHETRYVDMAAAQREMYDQIEDEFAVYTEEVTKETDFAIVQRTWLSRVAGGCDVNGKYLWDNKYRELLTLLKGELSDQPVVVFFRYTAELEAVATRLTLADIPNRRVTGDVDREGRVRAMEDVRSGKARVLLCQIKIGKLGLDMSFSSVVVYYSLGYSCEEIVQSEDRILSVMQKDPLLYIYLVTRNTVDEDVVYAATNKSLNARLFMTKFGESFTQRRRNKVAKKSARD